MGVLRPVTGVREFIDGRHDSYFVGRCWLAFHVRGAVAGYVVWGSPGISDIAAIDATTPSAGSPLARPLGRYLDLRRIELVDAAAFVEFGRYFVSQSQRLAEMVSRAAVVQAGGLDLALATGFPNLAALPLPREISLFTEPVRALEWVGCRSSVQVAGELDAAQANAVGTTPVVRDVRAYCAANVRAAELTAAARAMGLSPRSLQRKLQDHATSFQRELNEARVAAAKRLLAETQASIAQIATRVGCSSPQRFGVMFRRATGETPSHWRAMHAS